MSRVIVLWFALQVVTFGMSLYSSRWLLLVVGMETKQPPETL